MLMMFVSLTKNLNSANIRKNFFLFTENVVFTIANTFNAKKFKFNYYDLIKQHF